MFHFHFSTFPTNKTSKRWIVFIMCVQLSAIVCFKSVDCIRPVPGLSARTYENLGDINIGAFLAITQYAQHGLCAEKLRFPLLLQYIEAIVFAVKEINRKQQLLPNITLGYAILDDCVKESAAVAQALRYLPRKHCKNMTILDSDKQYDVVGVIGPERSENSIAVSLVLGPVKIPQISFLSSSDELSNKELHSYFLRTIPPDRLQVEAMFKFIKYNNWTYVSIVYSSGSYGESAYSLVKQMAPKLDICIAVHKKTSLSMTRKDYHDIITELSKKNKARVVMVFLGGEEMVNLFQEASKRNVTKNLIWIGSDGWAERLTMLPKESAPILHGAFTFMVAAPEAPQFNSYFDTIRPNTTNNPWFRDFWEWSFACSFDAGTCDETKGISESPNFQRLGLISKVIDTVYVYAHAIHGLVRENCPNVTGEAARDCINGTELLKYLKNVSFEGYSGHIRFDDRGNVNGSYIVSQVLPGNPLRRNPVFLIDPSDDIDGFIKLGNITWEYHPKPTDYVCNPPCEPGFYRITHLGCCWHCRKCRDNEVLRNGTANCHQCPMFSWPDPLTNYTQCAPIKPQFPPYTDGVMIFEMVASGLGMVTTIFVLIAFLRYKEASIIKAASRELSFLQLLAILLGFITMILYVLPPTNKTCSMAYWLFCFSLNLLHAPLLVKAIRIFRIFSAPSKCAGGLKFISPLSQVIISCLIVLGQVIISSIITTIEKPRAIQTQMFLSRADVELSCDMTLPGLASFLGYNLTIVLLCSVFAFKTRMVPDNFNESRFISVCVTTTLVIWLAFIPTYIHASRQYLKTLLLTLALLLNHSLALVFLFLSKLFAILYYSKSGAGVNPVEASPVPRFKLSIQNSTSSFLQYTNNNDRSTTSTLT